MNPLSFQCHHTIYFFLEYQKKSLKGCLLQLKRVFFENKIEKIKKSISEKVVPSMLFHIYLLLKRDTHLGFNAIKILKKISLAFLTQVETQF